MRKGEMDCFNMEAKLKVCYQCPFKLEWGLWEKGRMHGARLEFVLFSLVRWFLIIKSTIQGHLHIQCCATSSSTPCQTFSTPQKETTHPADLTTTKLHLVSMESPILDISSYIRVGYILKITTKAMRTQPPMSTQAAGPCLMSVSWQLGSYSPFTDFPIKWSIFQWTSSWKADPHLWFNSNKWRTVLTFTLANFHFDWTEWIFPFLQMSAG